MRILVESPNCNAFAGSNGGVGYGWVSRLAGRHEVHVVVYGSTFERGHPDVHAAEIAGVHVIRVEPSRARKLGTMTDFVAGARRQRDEILARVRPDVVHSVEPAGVDGPRALATTDVPYVVGPLLGGAANVARAFSSEVLGELPVTPAKGLLEGGPKRIALRLWNEALFGALPTSRGLAHAAMRRARVILFATPPPPGMVPAPLASRVRRLPLTGIDTSMFAPSAGSRVTTGPLRVLYAGRILPLKCLHLLIEALAGCDAELRVAGAAAPEDAWYEAFCRRRADDLGVAERIAWLGSVARDALPEEYASADVYCMLSLWDTYALTYLEASACGTPSLGLATGGTPEIVGDDRGWLVEPTTRAQVVDRVAEVLVGAAADRETARAKGAAARAYIETTHDWGRLLDGLESIYEEAIAMRPLQ